MNIIQILRTYHFFSLCRASNLYKHLQQRCYKNSNVHTLVAMPTFRGYHCSPPKMKNSPDNKSNDRKQQKMKSLVVHIPNPFKYVDYSA